MHDPASGDWWARFIRMRASPAASEVLLRMNSQIDAQRIPGARYVELAGTDHLPFGDTAGQALAEIEAFVTSLPDEAEPDRVLATVHFADIAGSTERAAELGDRRWRELLQGFQDAMRRELVRFRGREIDTAGDGVLAAFDGPARAVRCACAVGDAARPLGLAVRAGVHTGECEVMGDKLAGIAVHIGARVAAAAAPGEVLVSSTVRDLVAGSGLRFADRGRHTLKGVPGEWALFAVGPATS